ncbi:MAG: SCO family protein [Balneolaceae bacterium]
MRLHCCLFLLLIVSLLTAGGCDRLSVKESLSGFEVELINQQGETVHFPKSFRGETILVGFIYTHCPDICPLTTLNMKEVAQQIDDQDAHFIGISMDPVRDTPEVLSDYARNYGLNPSRWSLLTGEREEVRKLLERLDVIARRTPMRVTDSGRQVYFIDHSDKVSLLDGSGNIRQNYPGSELQGDDVLADMERLLARDL